jgi:hypothetical protein
MRGHWGGERIGDFLADDLFKFSFHKRQINAIVSLLKGENTQVQQRANAKYLALGVRVSANSGSPARRIGGYRRIFKPHCQCGSNPCVVSLTLVMRRRLQAKANPRDSDEPSL